MLSVLWMACSPPPRDLPGVVDQTRGLLYYCENNFPGAYHAPDVKYVCIAGRYMTLTLSSGQSTIVEFHVLLGRQTDLYT
jgi:hypothetical protein